MKAWRNPPNSPPDSNETAFEIVGTVHTVNHSQDEWVVGEFHTNSAEGFFSHFKRSVRGTYSHISEKHLHRYLAEFEFRYSHREKLGVDDTARADKMLKGVVGKRLTYQQAGARA